MRKVMIFGVFDGIHAGHRALLRQAKNHGDHLIVALAPDIVVRQLKGHDPKMDAAEREAKLYEEELVDEVVIGDAVLGTYDVIREHVPTVVVFGYDQNDLKKDLEGKLHDFNWKIEIVVADPYEPGKYHSSLLNK